MMSVAEVGVVAVRLAAIWRMSFKTAEFVAMGWNVGLFTICPTFQGFENAGLVYFVQYASTNTCLIMQSCALAG
jgi:hypothetical protein